MAHGYQLVRGNLGVRLYMCRSYDSVRVGYLMLCVMHEIALELVCGMSI